MADSKPTVVDHVETSPEAPTAVIDSSSRLQNFLAHQASLTRKDAIKEHRKAIAW
jgi:hypothetical protein